MKVKLLPAGLLAVLPAGLPMGLPTGHFTMPRNDDIENRRIMTNFKAIRCFFFAFLYRKRGTTEL